MPKQCRNCPHNRSAHIVTPEQEPVNPIVGQCQQCHCRMFQPKIERASEIRQELTEPEALPLNAWRNIAHDIAKIKGWHDKPRTPGDIFALIHSEVSEALEEHRQGHEPAFVYQNKHNREEGFFLTPSANAEIIDPDAKPQGIPLELADVILRILDWCGKHDIDIQRAIQWKARYNLNREQRHGGKRI